MEHFSIVLGLCRSAMQAPNEAVRGHVSRLIKALAKDEGAGEQILALQKLLVASQPSEELVPTRVILSKAALIGETLTPSVSPPMDRETGAPLAHILHPKPEKNEPLFNNELTRGLESLINEWRHVDILKAAGVSPALTTMLFGAPGTGKTMLAHSIAGQLGLPLIVAKLDGLISSFLGTTARNISSLFTFANRYKCILLLDEFDAVAKLRDDPHELGEVKRVVNTLLQCIDQRATAGFTIAITNHESLLDPAVWRRFDIRIHVPKPDFATRVSIIKAQFPTDGLEDHHMKFIAWATEAQGGSDIEKLSDFVKRQKVLSQNEVSVFDSVKQFVKLSATEAETNNRQLIVGEQKDLVMALTVDKQAQFNQEQLAALLNCTQSTVSRILKKSKAS